MKDLYDIIDFIFCISKILITLTFIFCNFNNKGVYVTLIFIREVFYDIIIISVIEI